MGEPTGGIKKTKTTPRQPVVPTSPSPPPLLRLRDDRSFRARWGFVQALQSSYIYIYIWREGEGSFLSSTRSSYFYSNCEQQIAVSIDVEPICHVTKDVFSSKVIIFPRQEMERGEERKNGGHPTNFMADRFRECDYTAQLSI